MKLQFYFIILSFLDLNQLMVSVVAQVAFFTVVIILSKIDLLIKPTSVFAGLISLQVGWFSKFVLWSFKVGLMNAFLLAIYSILSTSSRLLAICLASKFRFAYEYIGANNVTTNVGKEIFKLLDRHFPEGTPLHQIFNRKKVK